MLFDRRRMSLAVCVLAVWGTRAPASAAVRADFNGDGVLDTATLDRGARPAIRIALSGLARPLVSQVEERPLSLVAADLDRDGRVDLVGLSRCSRLFIWRNVNGRQFRRLHSRARRASQTSLGRPTKHFHGDPIRPDETGINSDKSDDVLVATASSSPCGHHLFESSRLRHRSPPRRSDFIDESTSPRAPPAAQS